MIKKYQGYTALEKINMQSMQINMQPMQSMQHLANFTSFIDTVVCKRSRIIWFFSSDWSKLKNNTKLTQNERIWVAEGA